MSVLINSVALGPGKDVLIDGSFIGVPLVINRWYY
jgi:hypothetical protein